RWCSTVAGPRSSSARIRRASYSTVMPAKVFGPGRLVGWNWCRPRHLICQGAPRVMELNLHANATTTPKERGYIQRSKKPVAELAVELGVSETTIRRWRDRTTVADRSHT